MADNARSWTGQDLIPALALAAVAALEAIVYTGFVDDSDDSLAVVLNLLMTAPLAARRRHLTLVAVTVTLSVLYLLASELTPTVAGYAGVAWALYLVGARASRRVSAAFGAVFLLNGVAPLGGERCRAGERDPARGGRGGARARQLADADVRARRGARRAGGMGERAASRASCTTWSPTTSR